VRIQAFQRTVEYFNGRRPEPPEIFALLGSNEEGILAKMIPGLLDLTFPYYLRGYKELHNLCPKPFMGITRVFEIIKHKHFSVAIVTGKGSHSAAISIKLLVLDQHIQIVETGFQDRADKPLSIRNVLRKWECWPSCVAYVGDTASDMRVAQIAGVIPLGAAWAESSEFHNKTGPLSFQAFYTIPNSIKWLDTIDKTGLKVIVPPLNRSHPSL
jgi:pyrophosphatase PpaX